MAFKKEIPQKPQGLTYGEILDRYILLNQVRNLPNEKLSFARSKNLMQLRMFEKRNSATNRIPLTEEFETYQKALNELRGKHLLTDKDGKSILIGDQPALDVANPALIAGSEKLKAKYAEAIKEREDDIKAYTDFMDEIVPESEMPKVHLVKKPSEINMTQDQVDACYWFLEE